MAAVKKAKTEKAEEIQKVSMNLTPADLENMDYLIKRLNCRNGVNAVSMAMKMAKQLCKLIDDGDKKIITKDSAGNMETINFMI